MTLNYRLIIERLSFPNGVVGGLITVVKSSLYLTGKTKKKNQTLKKKLARQVGNQEPTHRKVGSKPHLASRGFLSRVGTTC